MKNQLQRNLGSILALIFVCNLTYYLLLRDNFLHLSISSIIHSTHHLTIKQHLFVVGLLPIYIALMIFGAAMLGIYIGSFLQDCFTQLKEDKNSEPSLN